MTEVSVDQVANLPPRQKAVYEFVRDTIANTQIPPTIREIAKHLNIRSPNGVLKHLLELQKKGIIRRLAAKARGIHFVLVAALLAFVGCQGLAVGQLAPQALGVALADPPMVDLPPAWRCQNWTDRKGKGSCVHASTVMALHEAGYHNEARAWKASHEGACDAQRLERGLRAVGIPFVSTADGDSRFLDRSLALGRPCVIWWEGASHCVLLVHLDAKRAAICDPNCAHHQHWLSREQFFREWNHRDCRYAMSVLSAPPPYPKRRLPHGRFSTFLILRSPIAVQH